MTDLLMCLRVVSEDDYPGNQGATAGKIGSVFVFV